MLTIVFPLNSGVETHYNFNPFPHGPLQNPQVNLIFAGNWSTYQANEGEASTYLADEAAMRNAVQSIVQGPYLTGLEQYGASGTAQMGAVWSDPSQALPNPTVANAGNLQDYLQNSITAYNTTPPSVDVEHAPIYAVVLDPTDTGTGGTVGGFNDPGSYTVNPGILGSSVPIHMIEVGAYESNGQVNIDQFSQYFSHELAERVVDNHQMFNSPYANSDPFHSQQVADGEQASNSYDYRLNGFMVQAYWSDADQAAIVPNVDYPSSVANFQLTPTYSNTGFSRKYDLDVNPGFQPLNVSSVQGNVAVTYNGQTATFGLNDDALNSIKLESRTQVTVDDTNDNVPRSITVGRAPQLGSYDYVRGVFPTDIDFPEGPGVTLEVDLSHLNGNAIGVTSAEVTTNVLCYGPATTAVRVGGGFDTFYHPVNIFTPGSSSSGPGVSITIDDSGESGSHWVNIENRAGVSGWGDVSGLAQVTIPPLVNVNINYEYQNVASLKFLTSASNGNTVNVLETGVPTYIVDQNGFATPVNIGDSGGDRSILSDVHIDGPANSSGPPSANALIVVNDGNDPYASTIQLQDAPRDATHGVVKGVAPADIYYSYANAAYLTIDTSSVNNNIIDVLQTGVMTNLNNSDPYTVTVNIGYTTNGVQGILGDLYISNPRYNGVPTTSINVDDTGDNAARSANLSDLTKPFDFSEGSISGLAPGKITYIDGNTTSLSIATDAIFGNVINVLENAVPTYLVGDAFTHVYLGNPNDGTQSLLGNLYMESSERGTPDSGNLFITVDDSADGVRNPTLTTFHPLATSPAGWDYPDSPWGSISGLAGPIGQPGQATINYEYADTHSATININHNDTIIDHQTGSGATPVYLNQAAIVTGINPPSGPLYGGTVVTIDGFHLNPSPDVPYVLFGNTLAYLDLDSSLHNTDNEIHVFAPAATMAGAVDVRVVKGFAESAQSSADLFNYVPAPDITGISPKAGPLTGGTSVTISGYNLADATGVIFGNTPAASFTDNPNGTITAVSPMGAVGTVAVKVTTAGGPSAGFDYFDLSNQFTYSSAPSVSTVSPSSGPLGGGTTVTISGSDLRGVTAVEFGNTPAASFTYNLAAGTITAVSPAGTAGSVPVKVFTVGGQAIATSNDYFTYTAAPILSTVTPNFGPYEGGTTVTIQGTNLGGVTTKVYFGATVGTIVSDTGAQIVATSPFHAAGVVDVTVSTAGGTSPVVNGDKFDYEYFNPIVNSISPPSGLPSGGTSVTIAGNYFEGTTAVFFGGVSATSVVVSSDTQIIATSPAGTAGNRVHLTVVAHGLQSATSAADYFTYAPVPSVSSLSPSTGPVAGGTTVTIVGLNLSGATEVDFGSIAGTITFDSANQIQVTSPGSLGGAAGTVEVTVVNSYGRSSTSPADHFNYYVAGPVVTGLSPNTGLVGAQTTVTISGSSLSNPTAVYFGALQATILNSSYDQIVVKSPASGTPGAVNVTVGTAAGTSAVVPADQFTYGAVPSISALSRPTGGTGNIGPANFGDGNWEIDIHGANLAGATEVDFGAQRVTNLLIDNANQISLYVPNEGPGTVDVRVVTSLGTSAITPADQFTYAPGPVIIDLPSGSVGPLAGGTAVTIRGIHLADATVVDFGNTPVTSFTFTPYEQSGEYGAITVNSPPAGAAGAVSVTVTSPEGTSSTTENDLFTYFGIPTVSGVSPATGPLAGGNMVTIAGTGLTYATEVDFGGVAATIEGGALDGGDLLVIAPAGAALGTVDVTVTTVGGTTTDSSAYTYMPPPVVSGLSVSSGANPPSGALEGGTPVTITGLRLANAKAVYFGSSLATILSDSDGQIVVTSPQSPTDDVGAFDVTVITANGTSVTSSSDRFTYKHGPFITQVVASIEIDGTHAAGFATGGDMVTIHGDDLSNVAAVNFGNTPADLSTLIYNDDGSITIKSPAATAAGTVDITVTTAIGPSDISPADQFTYGTTPTVTGVSPASGSTNGNTQVTITGTGLAHAYVDFGSNGSTILSDSDGQVVVTNFQVGSAGAVDVTVRTPFGISATSASDLFTFMLPPIISTQDVSSGPVAGGTPVTLTGSDLANGTVDFGSNPGTIVSDTDGQIVVLSPEATNDSPGTVSLTVTTAYGTSTEYSGSHQFTYALPPDVTAISQSFGPAAGGTSVTISGDNLSGATAVDFGGIAAASFSVNGDGTIFAVSPPGAVATVDVTVVTLGATTAISPADHFTYVGVPSVSSISPTAGSGLGGTTVTITGTGLANATGVQFGNAGFAGTIVSNTDNQIVVMSPPATPGMGYVGTVDVTVMTAGGTSVTLTADQFTYVAAPVISGISPSFGNTLGSDIVMINGANLDGATAVDFGQNAGAIIYVSANQILAVSPAGAAGLVNVTVVAPGGTSVTSSADRFLYVGAPLAMADSYSVTVGSTLTVSAPGVLANDSDPQNLPLTAEVLANPLHGALWFNGDGSFTYAPDSGYQGADNFVYQADNGTFTSEPTLVSLTIGTQLTVTTAADSGPGSLRQAILDANGTPGTAHTIQFELSAGPQTINLLTPLPAATDPLTVSLDATQNVTVALSSASAWDNNDPLTVSGAGMLTLRGGIEGPGSLAVDAGSSLTANHIVQSALVIGGAAGSPATVTIAASDSSGNPLISAAAASSSNSSVSALSNSVAGNAGTKATLAEHLAAIRARRMAQQLAASPVSTGANDTSSGVAMPAAVVSTLVPTSATIQEVISTAAGASPMIFVHAMAHVDANVKSAAVSTVVSGSLGVPVGESPMSDPNVATSSVASQTGSSTVQDAAATRKILNADAVAAAFGSDNWEWLGSEPVAGSTYDSMDDVGGLLLGDDLLEAIGKKWGN